MTMFKGAAENETKRQRNARWRDDLRRYRAYPPRSWSGAELIWAKRLETLLNERRKSEATPGPTP